MAILPQKPLTPAATTVRDLVMRGRHPHQTLLRPWSGHDARLVDDALAATGLAIERIRDGGWDVGLVLGVNGNSTPELRGLLGQSGHAVRVDYAMRYGQPALRPALDALAAHLAAHLDLEGLLGLARPPVG